MDRVELARVIWRLEQPNESLYGSLRVDVSKAAAFLRELSAMPTEELSLKPHIGPFIEVQAVTDAMVDRFLSWRLPASVCADGCATNPNYPHPRSGTNLLNADEARQMLEHVMVAFARSPQATQPEKS